MLVEFEDSQGQRVPGVRRELTAQVEGAAQLLSFASANPITDENYESGRITSFDGRAMAVLRTGHETGDARLIISCQGPGQRGPDLCHRVKFARQGLRKGNLRFFQGAEQPLLRCSAPNIPFEIGQFL